VESGGKTKGLEITDFRKTEQEEKEVDNKRLNYTNQKRKNQTETGCNGSCL
jgi:hypothetical protein